MPGENGVSLESEKETEQQPEKMYYTLRLSDTYDNDTIGISMSSTAAAPANSHLDSRSESRALTLNNAHAFHDFFEVIFFYNAGNNGAANGSKIARKTWDIGTTPELSGVERNVNYAAVGAPATGSGSAMLFVGTKDDKTLLAVGRLSGITNKDGSSGTTTVTDDTESVTFTVTALKAGVAPNVGSSSFKTYSTQAAAEAGTGNGTTSIRNDIYIHTKIFPFFQLTASPNNVQYGSYNFGLDFGTGTPPAAPWNSFSTYAAGIVLAGGYNFEARNPRYIVTDGLYQYSSLLVQDVGMRTDGQLDMLGNNKTKYGAGLPAYIPEGVRNPNPPYNYTTLPNPRYFGNPVVFKIDTSASLPVPYEGTVFALVFEVFVHNLTAIDGSADSGGEKAVKWRISTGIGTKWLDLDDGNNVEGGAVFLGTGDVIGYMNQAGNTPPPPPPPSSP
jgi:hypothetical protein